MIEVKKGWILTWDWHRLTAPVRRASEVHHEEGSEGNKVQDLYSAASAQQIEKQPSSVRKLHASRTRAGYLLAKWRINGNCSNLWNNRKSLELTVEKFQTPLLMYLSKPINSTLIYVSS